MSELEVGETIPASVVNHDYELHDWGEMVDGQYTYALLNETDDGCEEYLVVVDQYRVVKEHDLDE